MQLLEAMHDGVPGTAGAAATRLRRAAAFHDGAHTSLSRLSVAMHQSVQSTSRVGPTGSPRSFASRVTIIPLQLSQPPK